MLLQVLDEGRLTDGQGKTVDFRNTGDHHDEQRGRARNRAGRERGLRHEREAGLTADEIRTRAMGELKRLSRRSS